MKKRQRKKNMKKYMKRVVQAVDLSMKLSQLYIAATMPKPHNFKEGGIVPINGLNGDIVTVQTKEAIK